MANILKHLRWGLWLVVLAGGGPAATAQTIEGDIRAADGAAVPYVNVGVLNRGLGTVSDERGHYRLAYDPAMAADTVRVSSVGYRPVRLLFRELLARPAVTLSPEPVSLNEVSVSASSSYRRTQQLGFDKPETNVRFNLIGNQLGTEIGTIIHLKRRPSLVQRVHFRIEENQAGPLLLRVNLYRLDKEGRPTDEKLLTRNIILTAPATPGLLDVDLTADHLGVDNDFLLALEWVQSPEQITPETARKLWFTGGLGTGQDTRLYARGTSQGEWSRMRGSFMGMKTKLGFFATVKD